ncbi:MAG: hypothetical protein CL661_05365, partial [Bacteroidetes bacterium]|nr:hypothetical protein [Bacteroidota bacterium]
MGNNYRLLGIKLIMQAVFNKIIFKLLYKFIAVFFLMFLGFTTIAQKVTTYDEAIIFGDNSYAKANLLDAKAYYQLAIKLKPGDDYAKNKILLIVEKMKTARVAEDEYYDIIDLADELYDKNNLVEAIAQYRRALKIIPADEYALTKVREIIKFQTNEKEKIESFGKAMEAGRFYITEKDYDKAINSFREAAGIFPDKDAPISELNVVNNLKAEYEQKLVLVNQKIEEAEKYLMIKNYSEALKIYTEANLILADNEEVMGKITELTPLAENQDKFNKQVEKADEFYIAKDFISARKQYLTAKKLWPEKNYPTDMVEKIDEKLENEKKDLEKNYNQYIVSGDSLMELKEYSQAVGSFNLALNLKPNEAYPKSKLREIDAILAERVKAFEANYDIMISSADSAFNAGLFNIAHDKYKTALEVKPDDKYPKSQLAKIESNLEEIAALEKLNKEYNDLILQADKLYSTGNYDLAIKKYREAQALKSIESYPQAKIDAITLLLADAVKQKQIDDKYNELILIAIQQVKNEKLAEARMSFVNAAELKPYEKMPQLQIRQIDSLIIVKANAAAIKQKFDQYISKGDSLKNQKEYALAIVEYDQALTIFPDDISARQKKKTVESIQINLQKEAERKKAYEDAITKGDELFEVGSFELARVEFEKAQNLRKDQEYPRNRLLNIASALERLAAENEKRYTDALVAADNFFEQQHYEDAVIKYQLANSIKPAERYPKQKIEICNSHIARRLKLIVAEYSVAISDADKLYASKIYDKAIVAFKKAEKIKPDETYPSEMINKINKFIEENSIVDVINVADTIFSGVTEKFDFIPIKINLRKSNYIFI